MPRKNDNNNGKNNNDNDKSSEPTFWRYWKRTILEDLDEIRNIIIECRMEQIRLQIEQEEIELRIKRLEQQMKHQWVFELEEDARDGDESD